MTGPGQCIADALYLFLGELYKQFCEAIKQHLDGLRIIQHLDEKAGHLYDVAGNV